MVVRIAEINSGPSGSTVFNDIEVPDVHLARPGDVLFAWSGSLTVTRWFRPEAIVNQHIFKVIPRDGLPVWLAFELIQMKLAAFRAIAAGKATTMGHIQRHHLDELVTVPAWRHLTTLDAELRPLWERALAAEQESLKLAELRDALLPKLMSGEIRVRDAEQAVEEAM
jgi:type I restriction enzyme S subunit